MQNTFERLKKVFSIVMPEYDTSALAPETDLISEIGMTSITMLLMAIAIEEEFGVKFGTVSPDRFKKAGDVCSYIDELRGV